MDDFQEVQVTYELPLDGDGFLRRQCPTCDQQFKWHHGPANEEAEKHADAGVYYCPLCGSPAEADHWFTDDQVDFIQGEAHKAAMPKLDEMLDGVFKGLSGPNIKVKRTGHLETPVGPDPLVEADDMVIVASPCHSFEPVKVPDDWSQTIHCLVCGERFAV